VDHASQTRDGAQKDKISMKRLHVCNSSRGKSDAAASSFRAETMYAGSRDDRSVFSWLSPTVKWGYHTLDRVIEGSHWAIGWMSWGNAGDSR
jgi:hypothetical protein